MRKNSFVFLGVSVLLVILSCGSLTATVKPEHIENDIIEVVITDFKTGGDGFEQLTISIKIILIKN